MTMIDFDLTHPVDDAFIDRIVDGALSPAELRAALDRLDREADGWKRCALAFLEAQCWSQTFRQLGDTTSRPPEQRRSPLRPVSDGLTAPKRWLAHAIAAGIAIAAFGLGLLANRPPAGAGRRSIEARSTPDAASLPPSDTGLNPTESGLHGPSMADSAATPVIVTPVARSSRTDVDDARQGIRLVGRVRLSSASADAEVPILSGPGIDAEWLENQPPPVSEYGQAVLERHGYQVDQRRRLIPGTLSDGRAVAIPVDLVQIRYTGNNPL
jgi:hypothetical protein